jgi:hypothetical protein
MTLEDWGSILSIEGLTVSQRLSHLNLASGLDECTPPRWLGGCCTTGVHNRLAASGT